MEGDTVSAEEEDKTEEKHKKVYDVEDEVSWKPPQLKLCETFVARMPRWTWWWS